jgi:hypothetical protein
MTVSIIPFLPHIRKSRSDDIRKLKHTVNKVSSLRDLLYSPVMLIINPESGSGTEISGSDNDLPTIALTV